MKTNRPHAPPYKKRWGPGNLTKNFQNKKTGIGVLPLAPLLFFGLSFLAASAFNSAHAWDLVLNQKGEISKPQVCVEDLGRVYAPPAEKEKILNNKNCFVFEALRPTYLSARELQEKLQFLESPPQSIRGAGIQISPEMKTLDAKSISALLSQKHLSATPSGASPQVPQKNKIEFKIIVDQEFTIDIPQYSSWEIRLEAKPGESSRHGVAKMEAGARRATVFVSIDTGTGRRYAPSLNAGEATFEVPYVLAKREVTYYAAKDLALGERLTRDVIESRQAWVESEDELQRGGYEEAPIGYKATQALSKEEMLTPHNTLYEPDVYKGNTLDLVYSRGAIEISIKARALEEGAIGETIQVETLRERNRFAAVVAGKTQANAVSASSFQGADSPAPTGRGSND